jgi:hypothetical protein
VLQIGIFSVPFEEAVWWRQHSEWHWIGCKAPCSTHLLMQLGLRFIAARSMNSVTDNAIYEKQNLIMSHSVGTLTDNTMIVLMITFIT